MKNSTRSESESSQKYILNLTNYCPGQSINKKKITHIKAIYSLFLDKVDIDGCFISVTSGFRNGPLNSLNYPRVGYFEHSLPRGVKDRRPELCALHFSSAHRSGLSFYFSNTETGIANMGQVGDITKEKTRMVFMATKSPDYFLAWWTNQCYPLNQQYFDSGANSVQVWNQQTVGVWVCFALCISLM